MKRCAVIMAAHMTPRWIMQAVESVQAQEELEGWEYELRLGVDGCRNVRTILERRGAPFWWSSVNVGCYVLRNSLIELEPADAYAIFDSDDVMFPRYLATLLPWVEKGMIAGASRLNTRVDLKPINRAEYRAGVCVVPRERWEELGGYREERVGSDVDLIDRALAQGIEVHRERTVLYLRRKRNGSLTQARDTGIRSLVRMRTRKRQTQAVRRGRLVVTNPKTVELERVEP